MHDGDDQKRHTEQNAVATERLGNGERGDEHRGHGHQNGGQHLVLPASTVFVSQAYDAHAHQTAARISRPRPSPAQVVSSEITAVICVNAKTKTRSK